MQTSHMYFLLVIATYQHIFCVFFISAELLLAFLAQLLEKGLNYP